MINFNHVMVFPIGSQSHLRVQGISTEVRNVLLDSFGDLHETLIVLAFSEHYDISAICIFLDSLISDLEDDKSMSRIIMDPLRQGCTKTATARPTVGVSSDGS